ncbi:MAG: SHOCT domain-containing protein [Oscillatoriales cyanobacterium C42_A2020_001]|nr:SHOCT domain-containing protein [Leptolyngbyaceae cyanobacterium C42_A2020_001]
MLSQPKDRKIASLLAIAGAVAPISGFHKFYLKQPVWGVLYVLLSWTPIPRVASGIEAIWYLFQDSHEFDRRFNAGLPAAMTGPVATVPDIDPDKIGAIADALRKLDQLRADGLISEYEFEQKRRTLLDLIA